MSLVADGPEIMVSGAVGVSPASPSGTECTTWSASQHHHVPVGHQGDHPATLVGAAVQDDRPGLGDRHPGAGEHGVDPSRSSAVSGAVESTVDLPARRPPQASRTARGQTRRDDHGRAAGTERRVHGRPEVGARG